MRDRERKTEGERQRESERKREDECERKRERESPAVNAQGVTLLDSNRFVWSVCV